MENDNKDDLVKPESAQTEKVQPEVGTPAKNKKAKADSDTVEVSKETLQKLLERLDILEEAADKGRLERVTALKNGNKKLVKKVNVSTYQDRIVVGWKSVRDDVFFDREGKLHEDQVVALFFHKGKTDSKGNLLPEAELNIQSFARLTKRLECEILEESKDQEGNITLLLEDKSGQQFRIGLDFINAS